MKDTIKKKGKKMPTNTELTTYKNLPPFEKNIVYILSIIYTPIATTLLKDCLAAAGVKTNKGLRFDDSYKYRSLMLNELRPTVDMLEKAGIIQKREYGRLALKPAIADIAIRQTVKENRFNSLLKAIETKIDLMNGEKMDLVAAVRILFYQKKWMTSWIITISIKIKFTMPNHYQRS
ncbi:MAG: hypothetical protein OMM_03897 [Candidatus Magnetoglobus multicellularis str. Araruama]|uniref:Uncharacterized protein n=1 Tax=Candidatus Magnetoglobus multicellularis str. Araruama TaxID=890399 RepID=A0A1V1P410_9BACT|nr:MAG: hypothetical protein OMM_03897 [Candidatus Magnetoglobus multicellularis str. Araruama]